MGSAGRKKKTAAEYKKMLPPQPFPNCPVCRSRDGKYKAAYPSEPDAARACREYAAAERNNDPEWARMNVYRCPENHGFHIGHGHGRESPPARSNRSAAPRGKTEPERFAKDFAPPPEWLSAAPEPPATRSQPPALSGKKLRKDGRQR